ncbi:MAG: AAA family ATPase [Erythrobacter sp.]
MRLIKFRAEKVHGYLNYDVDLDKDIVFLTGINGSGKTTIINLIAALISPDLRELQSIQYSLIELTIEDDSRDSRRLRAVQAENEITLKIMGSRNEFRFPIFVKATSVPRYRADEDEAEHFRELLSTSFQNSIIQEIVSLPTPMYLGLDRRPRFDDLTRGKSLRSQARPRRNLFGGPIHASLMEARRVAEEAYRRSRVQTSDIGDELQRKMILNLLTFSEEDFLRITGPTEREKRDLNQAIKDVREFESISNLPAEEVRARIDPFLKRLKEISQSIPAGAQIGKGDEFPSDVLNNLFLWSSNKHQLKKLKVISDFVSSFNKRQRVAMRPFEVYRRLVDKFFNDSGKRLFADDVEGLGIEIEGVKGVRALSYLSSGEAQVFVMLSNLAFHPDAQEANVFIIDEPELSLHIRWQEIFVQSLLQANEKVQYIMATHSPSIILDRIENCIEVKPIQKIK